MNGIHAKAGFAIGLLLLALLGGLYFSGFLAQALLKLSAPLQPTTYWDYFRALDLPQVRPYAGEIKAAGAVGFGLPLLGYGVALFLILRARAKSLHGDARFATRADLARSGHAEEIPERHRDRQVRRRTGAARWPAVRRSWPRPRAPARASAW